MGSTNIRFARDLLRHAGGEQFMPAIMPELNRFVHLQGHFFEQEELDTYAKLLSDLRKDTWLHKDKQGNLVTGRADDPIDRPSVLTSSGLKENHRPAVRRIDEPDTTPKQALAFVLVIQGKSAALCGKVRLFYTLDAAAAAMFAEAANGYSTVFSAAILRADAKRFMVEAPGYRKVDTISALAESGGEKGKAIAMLCGGERFGS